MKLITFITLLFCISIPLANAISENLKEDKKILEVDDAKIAKYASRVAAWNFDQKQCLNECGLAPDLLLIPKPNEAGFYPAIKEAMKYNQCLDECQASKAKKDAAKSEEKSSEEEIKELNRKLKAWSEQVNVLQEKEPQIYNKLFRESKPNVNILDGGPEKERSFNGKTDSK